MKMDTGSFDELLRCVLLGSENDARRERALALDTYLTEIDQLLCNNHPMLARNQIQQMRRFIAWIAKPPTSS
jgi:hypothetical protein